ncbi:putative serine/threonine-protein kinase [Pycnococcus provasolii]
MVRGSGQTNYSKSVLLATPASVDLDGGPLKAESARVAATPVVRRGVYLRVLLAHDGRLARIVHAKLEHAFCACFAPNFRQPASSAQSYAPTPDGDEYDDAAREPVVGVIAPANALAALQNAALARAPAMLCCEKVGASRAGRLYVAARCGDVAAAVSLAPHMAKARLHTPPLQVDTSRGLLDDDSMWDDLAVDPKWTIHVSKRHMEWTSTLVRTFVPSVAQLLHDVERHQGFLKDACGAVDVNDAESTLRKYAAAEDVRGVAVCTMARLSSVVIVVSKDNSAPAAAGEAGFVHLDWVGTQMRLEMRGVLSRNLESTRVETLAEACAILRGSSSPNANAAVAAAGGFGAPLTREDRENVRQLARGLRSGAAAAGLTRALSGVEAELPKLPDTIATEWLARGVFQSLLALASGERGVPDDLVSRARAIVAAAAAAAPTVLSVSAASYAIDGLRAAVTAGAPLAARVRLVEALAGDMACLDALEVRAGADALALAYASLLSRSVALVGGPSPDATTLAEDSYVTPIKRGVVAGRPAGGTTDGNVKAVDGVLGIPTNMLGQQSAQQSAGADGQQPSQRNSGGIDPIPEGAELEQPAPPKADSSNQAPSVTASPSRFDTARSDISSQMSSPERPIPAPMAMRALVPPLRGSFRAMSPAEDSQEASSRSGSGMPAVPRLRLPSAPVARWSQNTRRARRIDQKSSRVRILVAKSCRASLSALALRQSAVRLGVDLIAADVVGLASMSHSLPAVIPADAYRNLALVSASSSTGAKQRPGGPALAHAIPPIPPLRSSNSNVFDTGAARRSEAERDQSATRRDVLNLMLAILSRGRRVGATPRHSSSAEGPGAALIAQMIGTKDCARFTRATVDNEESELLLQCADLAIGEASGTAAATALRVSARCLEAVMAAREQGKSGHAPQEAAGLLAWIEHIGSLDFAAATHNDWMPSVVRALTKSQHAATGLPSRKNAGQARMAPLGHAALIAWIRAASAVASYENANATAGAAELKSLLTAVLGPLNATKSGRTFIVLRFVHRKLVTLAGTALSLDANQAKGRPMSRGAPLTEADAELLSACMAYLQSSIALIARAQPVVAFYEYALPSRRRPPLPGNSSSRSVASARGDSELVGALRLAIRRVLGIIEPAGGIVMRLIIASGDSVPSTCQNAAESLAKAIFAHATATSLVDAIGGDTVQALFVAFVRELARSGAQRVETCQRILSALRHVLLSRSRSALQRLRQIQAIRLFLNAIDSKSHSEKVQTSQKQVKARASPADLPKPKGNANAGKTIPPIGKAKGLGLGLDLSSVSAGKPSAAEDTSAAPVSKGVIEFTGDLEDDVEALEALEAAEEEAKQKKSPPGAYEFTGDLEDDVEALEALEAAEEEAKQKKSPPGAYEFTGDLEDDVEALEALEAAEEEAKQKKSPPGAYEFTGDLEDDVEALEALEAAEEEAKQKKSPPGAYEFTGDLEDDVEALEALEAAEEEAKQKKGMLHLESLESMGSDELEEKVANYRNLQEQSELAPKYDSADSEVEDVDASKEIAVEATPLDRARSKTPVSWATPHTPANTVGMVPKLLLGLDATKDGIMDTPSARFTVYSQPQSEVRSPIADAANIFPEGFFAPVNGALKGDTVVTTPALRATLVELTLLLLLDEHSGWQMLHGAELELEEVSRVLTASLRRDPAGLRLLRDVQSLVQDWPAALRSAGERLLRLCHACGITATICHPSSAQDLKAPVVGAGAFGVPLLRLARGARSILLRGALPTKFGEATVVKTTEASLAEVHAELCALSVLADCRDDSGRRVTCELLDYGFGLEGGFFFAFKAYPASLRQWRRAHVLGVPSHATDSPLPMYLEAAASVAAAIAAVHAQGVVHFDLKSDNVLIEPLPGVSNAELWHPAAAHLDGQSRLPFHCVLTDFGDAKVLRQAGAQMQGLRGTSLEQSTYLTMRARGTEVVRPPEMLTTAIGNNAILRRKLTSTFDRRRRVGAGPKADVWALGCLVYEVLTGLYLFSDADYTAFFGRITTEGVDLLPPEAAEQIGRCPDSIRPRVERALLRLLERDAERRPLPHDAARILAEVAASIASDVPHAAPVARAEYGTDSDAGEVWLSAASAQSIKGETLARPTMPSIPALMPQADSSDASGSSIVVNRVSAGVWASRITYSANASQRGYVDNCVRFGAILIVDASGGCADDTFVADITRRCTAPGARAYTLALSGDGDDGGSVADALDDASRFLADDMTGADALLLVIGELGAESALTALVVAASSARSNGDNHADVCLYASISSLRALRTDAWMSQRHASEVHEWLERSRRGNK